jgi:DNA-binding transcriptional MocR family regulator
MMAVSTATLVQMLGEWRRGGPAHERLAATLRALALDGRLPLESRLPAERTLATTLGVSRATVTAAYDRLRADGYLSSRQGSGSWLTVPGGYTSGPEGIVPADGLDLRVAALPAPAALDDLAREAVADFPRWLDHHGYEPLGLPPLREAIAARFTARGLPTRAEQILVTNGALQAIDLCVRALLRRGRSVLVEIPSYPAALDALRHAGGRLRPVPVTPQGWDLAALEATARSHQPALAYLIPDFQNPTAALMDESARRRALRALERVEAPVIIDESFAELDLDGGGSPLPTAAFGGNAITVGSLSKTVWGGLRIGWVRAEPILIRRLAFARATVDMATPVLDQLLAARALRHFDELLDERRRVARVRRRALIDALERHAPAWSYEWPSGGLFVWARLPARISTGLAVGAGERGVHITPGPRFGSAGLLEGHIRLPFTLAPEQLDPAVATLAAVAAELVAGGHPADGHLADGLLAGGPSRRPAPDAPRGAAREPDFVA